MKNRLLVIALLSLFALTARGQQEVRFGQHRYTPPASTDALYAPDRSTASLWQQHRHLLLQFRQLPTADERKQLVNSGIRLHGYYGSNTFAASVDVQRVQRGQRSGNIVAAFELRPEWKVSAQLAEGRVPAHALAAGGQLLVQVHYAPTLAEADVRAALRGLGLRAQRLEPRFFTLHMQLSRADMLRLAQQPWVHTIKPTPAPQQLYNRMGRGVIGADVLGIAPELRGRGLTGRGVRVGIWDGNVAHHPDYGSRLHQQEFEMTIEESGGHGMHVAGTVAGAGLLNSAAMGMAPEADIYTYNFNVQSNGLHAYEEMFEARERFGISITQNSYGVYMDNFCDDVTPLVYDAFGEDLGLDFLACLHPNLLHLFAAGNEQQSCDFQYGSSTTRLKNALIVGAVDDMGRMVDFSSWGPMDDGRLLPTVCAKGEAVLSTMPDEAYGLMDGTSMATPGASGLMALLVERYRQLNGGEEPLSSLLRAVAANTADDRGEPGPDYQYGYGILNGGKAAETLEQGWYGIGSIAQGDADAEFTINVPTGTKRLRVMLAWTDTISAHEHYHGEPALVNDLDLTVDGLQPWILDRYCPECAAERGRDSLNNLEQVTIDNPSPRGYTVKVSATRVASNSQQYAVAYYIEREAPLVLISPQGGELLAPGDELVARYDNANAPVTIEISYDGGQTYVILARATDLQPQMPFAIPADAPATDNALLRVSDGRTYSVSAAPFTIMGVPRLELNAQGTGCSAQSHTLSWDAVPGASAYEVLRANVGEGSYSAVTTVSETSYNIDNQYINPNEHNVFAVRALSGGIVGRRSVAVMLDAPQPVVITANRLPFREIFAMGATRHIEVIADDSLDARYGDMPAYFEPELGERYIILTPNASVHGASVEAPFEGTERNTVVLRLCNVDLSAVDEGTPVVLSFLTMGRCGNEPRNNAMRVRIDGQPVPNLNGSLLHHPKQIEETDWTSHFYDLSPYVGQSISIDIEAAMLTTYDGIGFARIEIDQMAQAPDLQIIDMQAAESGHNLGVDNPVSITLFNKYHRALRDVPVAYSINGKTVSTEVIKEIGPYQQLRYTFGARADLSSANELGQLFDIEVEAMLDADADTSNNKALWQVSSFGNAFVLPYAELIDAGIFGKNSTDARTVKRVEGSLMFVDDGGAFGAYRSNNQSSVRFVPSTPGRVIQITFTEFDTEPIYDAMGIWTRHEGFPAYSPDPIDPDATLDGALLGPATFVSSADDGGICLTFTSDETTTAQGWVARVEEVDPVNLFSLRLHPMAYEPSGLLPVTITVQNLADVPADNVRVAFELDNDRNSRVEELIASIGPRSAVTHTFAEPADMSLVGYHALSVMVLNADAVGRDNRVDTLLLSDAYCALQGIDDPERAYITSVAMAQGDMHDFYDPADGRIDYQLHRSFTAYTQNAELAELTINISNPLRGDAIGVAVDWDDDGTFELVGRANVQADEYVYTISLDNGLQAGQHRMRVGLMDAQLLSPCPAGTLSHGDVKDFILNVIDAPFPTQHDFGIEIEGLTSGLELTDAEPLSVIVYNNSPNAAAPGAVQVEVDGATFSESIDEVIEPFDLLFYTFTHPIDLSAVGEHNVSVRLASPDDEASNDEAYAAIHNVVPEPNGLYAIEMLSTDDEHINLGTLNSADFDAMTFTLEAWVKLMPAQVNNIFRGKDVVVSAMSRPELGVENALVVSFGGQSVFYTDNDVLTPGLWQHVAVSVQPFEHKVFGEYPVPTVYINGVSHELYEEDAHMGQIVDSYDEELLVAHRMGGHVKAVRVWEQARSAASIAADMYRLVRRTDGELPVGCLAEFALDEGPDNTAVHSGFDIALLSTSRGNAVWVDPAELIASMSFEGQTEPVATLGPDRYGVKLDPMANIAAVGGEVLSAWPQATIAYNNQPLDGPATFDFSTGSITLRAQARLFGRSIDRNITVVGAHDASSACELLQLSALAANPGLSDDVAVNPIAATSTIDLSALPDLSAVVFSFTVSDGASLLYDGQSVANGDDLTLDLTQPALLTVLAADGKHSQCYSLSAHIAPNSIAGLPSSISFIYGDAPQQLAATATSGLPVGYASSNHRVATVTDGWLRCVGVGTATISAYQDGGNGYGPAAEQQFEVTVQPKSIAVQPLSCTIAHSDPIPQVRVDYQGLVRDADSVLIQIPSYQVFVGGELFNPADGYLPAGNHDWLPTVDAQVQGNYAVDFLQGTLQVASWSPFAVSFEVTSAGSPVPNARIEICDDARRMERSTDAAGRASITLASGTAYSYMVQADGYAPVVGDLEQGTSSADVAVELLPLAHTLTYTADAHGAIRGIAVQQVADGGAGQAVEAIPVRGYSFVRWSDGSTANPRSDANVQADVDVEAQFALNSFNISYMAAANGRLDGVLSQTIEFERLGSPVTAIPDANHRFVGWSDGRRDNPRTDLGTANMQLTALFEYAPDVLVELPYAQDFDASNGLPSGWYAVDNLAKGSAEGWRVLTDYIGMAQMNGGFALIGTYLGNSAEADAALLSPWFNVSDLTAIDTLHVDFRYMYAGFAPTAHFGLSYRTQSDGSWVELWAAPNQNEAPLDVFSAALSIVGADIAGASRLQLRWSYADREGFWAGIDSLVVAASVGAVRYQLTINVVDENAQPVEGARVVLGNTTLSTDARGNVVDSLFAGGYAYSIEKDGYRAHSGEVQLSSDTLLKVVLSQLTGLRGASIAQLSVHPNPTTGELWVDAPQAAELRVYSISGQLLLRQPAQHCTYVDLSVLPAGVYIVRLGNAVAKVVRM